MCIEKVFNEVALMDLGYNPKDYGLHSLRSGLLQLLPMTLQKPFLKGF